MALPRISSTVYEMTIPSTGKTVKFRPFLVKEQKALLLAQQNDDTKVMINTLKGVIKDCVQDDINVDTLAIFDLEYVLLQLRSKSIQEKAELLFTCDACEKQTQISFDVTKIEITKNESHTNNIKLSDDIGVVMKYPSIDIVKKIDTLNTSDMDSIIEVITSCIDYVYDSENMYHAAEQTKEELADFVGTLNAQQFAKLQEFFNTMPKLEQKVDFKCPHCGHEHNKTLQGINNFF